MTRGQALRTIVLGAAAKAGIAISWVPDVRMSRANVEARVIYIHPNLENLESALAALHEIGHVLYPCLGRPAHQPMFDVGEHTLVVSGELGAYTLFCLQCEEAAWNYVVYVFGDWWTQEMETIKRRVLARHRQEHTQNHV